MEKWIEELRHLNGHEVGVSQWIRIDQRMIDDHAANTGDDSWIHTDPARAKLETPFGGTIAQSFLLLSHLTEMASAIDLPLEGVAYRQNYGFDRVRMVKQNPNAILLFDEIEKAHASTIHLFLQLLDRGRLEDKNTGAEV
ncbi:MAG: MaoC/PaaZ C-terminal domain-containing protein, partial [Gammaproteobacteria bacterium]|nr:MaoC/PaaZ C-terminal domain-containing protein [Gammaproteobacteria bacterium]